MNKNILYTFLAVLFVIVLLGALGAYKFRHEIRAALSPASTTQTSPVVETPPPNATPNTNSNPVPVTANEVDYTDTGFSPNSLTVKKGTTVNFLNKSSSPMWIASNPHPIHTDLPGFDQKSPGDTYSFTFDKVGTWGFHNHRNPSVGGTIIVTE